MASGLLLIDKPSGVTSRYVDNQIQRLFHARKVGHLGTLDPFATGLLIVAVNEATKYLPFLPDEDKTYVATLKLGVKTDTGDYTGNIVEEKNVPSLDEKTIKDTLFSFLGEQEQLPPMTSAIKVDGVALYKHARKGEEIERKKRKIFVHEISLMEYEGDTLVFNTKVSKGTYIRTLGEDIALALGTVGHLRALRRVKVGEIEVTEALPLETAQEADLKEPSLYVPYPRIELEDSTFVKAHNGVKLSFDQQAVRLLLVFEGKAVSVYERESGNLYRCLRGL